MPIKASATAPKVNTVGYQMVLSTHCRKMARKPRNDTLPGGPTAYNIYNVLDAYYEGQTFVSVAPFGGDEPVIYSDTLVGTNQLRLIVCGHEEQTTVTALFDNLGKGASGAAVQNMNLMLGFDETAGLE